MSRHCTKIEALNEFNWVSSLLPTVLLYSLLGGQQSALPLRYLTLQFNRSVSWNSNVNTADRMDETTTCDWDFKECIEHRTEKKSRLNILIHSSSCLFLMSRDTGIPSFSTNVHWRTARMDRELQTFNQFKPGRALPRLLTATQDLVLAAHRGRAWRLMARWSSVMTNSTWWFSDSASDAGGAAWPRPEGVTAKTCVWCSFRFCGVWMIRSALCGCAVHRQQPSSGGGPC